MQLKALQLFVALSETNISWDFCTKLYPLEASTIKLKSIILYIMIGVSKVF